MDVEKLENSLRCLLSDNPACAGRFLREEYKPKPHDDCIIRPCKREANCILDKLHAMTENITKHDDSLFTKGGKPKTGLNCLHNFNNEKRHYIKSGLEKDVLHLVADKDRVMVKYKANMKLAPGPQHLKQEKEKAEKKGKKRKLAACENRRKRACRIFCSLGGAPLAEGGCLGLLHLRVNELTTVL